MGNDYISWEYVIKTYSRTYDKRRHMDTQYLYYSRIGPPPLGIGEECRIGLPTVPTSTLSEVYKRLPPGLK